ncbi:hypothetical protein BDR07DRAFT_1371562 [Suillus spraguei]|nr:hypothetical protein BDR07DRAFT_1371562 [Suillus spraguei]
MWPKLNKLLILVMQLTAQALLHLNSEKGCVLKKFLMRMDPNRYGRMHMLIQSISIVPSEKNKHVKAQPDDVDTNGIPIDINVQSIIVFEKTGTNGKVKKKGCVLVNEPITLDQHAEANFVGKYQTWAKANIFESMLPGDIKDHKEKAVVSYSDKLFKTAAIEWLIAMDQLIQALEHAKFKDMIDMAAHATNDIKIPGRKATCAEIMCIFKNHLTKRKVTLNVCLLILTISPYIIRWVFSWDE